MRQLEMHEAEAQLRLEASVLGLAERVPQVSARVLFSKGQRILLIGLGLATVIGLLVAALTTLIVIIALATVLYIAVVGFRFRLFLRSVRDNRVLQVSDDEAMAEPADLLPSHSVLIAAYHEHEVINHLLECVGRIDYPLDRLQVLLLVEEDDRQTLDALNGADPGPQFEVVLVPPSQPRTKPKALNYGLTVAHGELVTVYDAEDIPDPLQLRRAAVALSRDLSLACLQSKLSYHNPEQNLITRWFTLEYAIWFSYFLPGLASLGAPVPLGGTSNHFRRSVLRGMGAWDPFNVTEDADLGIRMAREGFAVGILESTTLEEANSDFVNWVRQRSRWYKGYLQTFMVHMRAPRKLISEIGLARTIDFSLFVGGTPLLAFLNPIFWVLTPLWFIAQPEWVKALFPAPVYYVALLSLVLGNFFLLYLNVVSCRLVGRPQLVLSALIVPVYWVMMSMAAAKAIFQLISQPTHWEKTFHGLGDPQQELVAMSGPQDQI